MIETFWLLIFCLIAGPLVWDFSFWSLVFVWELLFGAWNFHDLN
jgi:hypothetical protein